MFFSVIQMAEDRASAAAMVEMTMAKLAGKEVFGSRGYYPGTQLHALALKFLNSYVEVRRN